MSQSTWGISFDRSPVAQDHPDFPQSHLWESVSSRLTSDITLSQLATGKTLFVGHLMLRIYMK